MTNEFDDEMKIRDDENNLCDSEASDLTNDVADDIYSKEQGKDNNACDKKEEEYSNVVDELYSNPNGNEYGSATDDLYEVSDDGREEKDVVVGDNSRYINEGHEKDENFKKHCSYGSEFDYMSYMSGAKDLKEDIFEEEKEEDEIKLKSEKSIFKTIIISMLVSLLVSASVCGGFLLVVSYFNNGSIDSKSKEVFTTHKMVTIENKSDELVAEIAEKVSPSIVCIKETILTRDFLFGITEAKGHGSGIVFREDGYILTNNHVIESALESNTNNLAKGCKIEVILPSSSDNKTYEAKVIGRDSKTDLAVIKIEKTGLVAATFGNSDELRVGEIAVAIGNPYSIEFMGTVTSGIISGLNRTIQSEDGRQFKLIQTDAAINSGNSGGALVNSKGEVIGINTLKLVDSGIEGLSFAVPSNTAKEIADNLVEYKYVKGRPLLGITIDPRYTESLAKRYGMPAGVYVYSVDLLSAAYKAGVEVGDVITEFNGVAVKNINELNAQKEKYKAGDEVTLKIYKTKDGKAKTVRVKLGEDVGTSS